MIAQVYQGGLCERNFIKCVKEHPVTNQSSPNISLNPRDGPWRLQSCRPRQCCSWLRDRQRHLTGKLWVSERHIIVDNSNCVFCSTGREESAQLCVYVGEEKVEKQHDIICIIITIIILSRWSICGGARAPHTLQTHWPPSSPGVETLSKVDRYLLPATVYYKQKTVFNITHFDFHHSAQRAWPPLPLQRSMMKDFSPTMPGENILSVLLQQLLLCLSLQKDHRVLARIWSEWEGEHHNCWPDETWGEKKTSQLWKPDERWHENNIKNLKTWWEMRWKRSKVWNPIPRPVSPTLDQWLQKIALQQV